MGTGAPSTDNYMTTPTGLRRLSDGAGAGAAGTGQSTAEWVSAQWVRTDAVTSRIYTIIARGTDYSINAIVPE